ncbi:hypothetical protein [Arthrobacter gengyunqii]|uniref:YxeA family protein n=1 Tax=Arthrobacter gengyunqii TaxID=2886940 RepID=A0ABS8GKB3_9MICC|nr:hypothetical protein [Arthrobacter gengyunqii]MCC3266901.1 hypothetical protein [Arthrobacter gengyunqii]
MSLKDRLGCWLFILVMLGVWVVLPAAVFGMQEYNNTQPRTYRNCTVTQAEPDRSGTKRGKSNHKVLIDTSDCGDYELRHGITGSNYRDIAQGLTPGEYRLELAATAVAFEEVHKFFGNRVIVESLEKTTSQ